MTAAAFRFEPRTADEIAQEPEPGWTIHGLVPAGGLTLVSAEPGAGKSVLALSWAMAAACGLDWNGRPVTAGRVLYLFGEGSQSRRILAWQAANPGARMVHGVYFATLPRLIKDDELAAVRLWLEQNPCVLVIVDTLHCAAPGLDENSAADAGLLLRGLDWLRRTGSSVVGLHHHGKDASRMGQYRLRGSSAFPASADAVLTLDKDLDHVVTIRTAKLRDGEPSQPFRLRISGQDIGDGRRGPVLLPVANDTSAGPTEVRQDDRVLAVVRAAGREGCTRAQVVQGAAIGMTAAWQALHRLGQEAAVVQCQQGKALRYWTVENAPTPVVAPAVAHQTPDSTSDSNAELGALDLSSPNKSPRPPTATTGDGAVAHSHRSRRHAAPLSRPGDLPLPPDPVRRRRRR